MKENRQETYSASCCSGKVYIWPSGKPHLPQGQDSPSTGPKGGPGPVTAVVFLDSGATGFVTTDSSAPVSTMKSMFWHPTFTVTMGAQGPDISEPQQP